MAVKPLLLDQTGQQILGALQRTNAILAGKNGNPKAAFSSMAEIGSITRKGQAPLVLDPGDKITVPYHYNNNTYDFVWNVTNPDLQVTLPTGEVVPGVELNAHYATIESMPFDEAEAFYCNKTGSNLPAGTYHIVLGATWGTATAGAYQFTLPVPLPPNGKLKAFRYGADSGNNMKTEKLHMYQADGKTLVNGSGDITVTDGNGGTNLGTLGQATVTESTNMFHYFGYGCNHYHLSNVRQWLNSRAAAGQWFQPQHDFDLASASAVNTYKGFMAGFEDEFLEQIGPVKVKTAKNNLNSDGGIVETFDTFYLPSLEEIYISPQYPGEGVQNPYFKRLLGKASPVSQGGTYPELIKYRLDAHTSAELWRLRSAYRGDGYFSWHVHASGYVNYTYPLNSRRCSPSCVIR